MLKNGAEKFKDAVGKNDLETMRDLVGKDPTSYLDGLFADPAVYARMTPGMLQLVVDSLPRMQGRWYRKPATPEKIRYESVLPAVIGADRMDLLPVVLEPGHSFDYGQAICCVIQSRHGSASQEKWLERLLAGGHELISRPEEPSALAISNNNIEALRKLEKAGLPVSEAGVRANNEQLLRVAAEQRRDDLCLYLMERFGADPRVALSECNRSGAFGAETFLRALVPDAERPATVESLSAEMKELKDMVRELTTLVRRLSDPAPLDKPQKIPSPKGNTS